MALYIVLENNNPGFDPFVNGKVLGQSEKQFAEVAGRLGVRPLMEFFSINPQEAAEFLESEGVSDVAPPRGAVVLPGGRAPDRPGPSA